MVLSMGSLVFAGFPIVLGGLARYVRFSELAITCGEDRSTSPVIASFAEDVGQFLRFGRAVLT
mgnify:CR=1 FL=1|jgi:hypothetical protein